MTNTPDIATARALINSALEKAGALDVRVSIAVLDVGGHLVAFERFLVASPAELARSVAKEAPANVGCSPRNARSVRIASSRTATSSPSSRAPRVQQGGRDSAIAS